MITIKKVTRLRVRISKSTLNSIPYGFSLWSETNTPFLEVNLLQHRSLPSMVSSKCVENHMITIKKVTRLRVRISKSTIK